MMIDRDTEAPLRRKRAKLGFKCSRSAPSGVYRGKYILERIASLQPDMRGKSTADLYSREKGYVKTFLNYAYDLERVAEALEEENARLNRFVEMIVQACPHPHPAYDIKQVFELAYECLEKGKPLYNEEGELKAAETLRRNYYEEENP